jgi:uncharacterized Zn finger protein (UPF0148 family)
MSDDICPECGDFWMTEGGPRTHCPSCGYELDWHQVVRLKKELDECIRDACKELNEKDEEIKSLKREIAQARGEEAVALEMMKHAVDDVTVERAFNELVATKATQEIVDLRASRDRLQELLDSTMAQLIKTQHDRDRFAAELRRLTGEAPCDF